MLLITAVICLSSMLSLNVEKYEYSQGPAMKNISDKISKSDAEWRRLLNPIQYHILRERGTESPFSGQYIHNYDRGIYVCAGCGNELFSSDTKFDSRTGWPSFRAPIASDRIENHIDKSLWVSRIEITCSVCGGHLGHVFNDGAAPTGLRYCINSAALKFIPAGNDKL